MSNEHLNVVGIGGTLRENSTGLGALNRVLQAAEEAGAETELLDLWGLDLPMYTPGRKLDEYDENVAWSAPRLETSDEFPEQKLLKLGRH